MNRLKSVLKKVIGFIKVTTYISDPDLVGQIYLTHIKNSSSAVNFVLKAFVIPNLVQFHIIIVFILLKEREYGC